VGIGKVGTVLARLLHARGFTIGAVYSRTTINAEVLGNKIGAKVAVFAADVASTVDLVLLTVPDDAISLVTMELAALNLTGKAVVHTSGVHEAVVLSSLSMRGAWVGSLHPIYPFADIAQSLEGLPGVVFGLQTGSDVLRGWLTGIVMALDGQVLMIATGQKALYHSALVFASNYGVTLYAIAQHLLEQLGAEREVLALALNTLMMGMVRNLQAQGVPDALTGPLVRGDIGTVEAHLKALQTADPRLVDLYVRLAQQTLPLVAARGIETGLIETILRKKMDDADNHT
jgi:predicted short-subunit dehydrogenase-like oxidoreductase (DUF2520 family)